MALVPTPVPHAALPAAMDVASRGEVQPSKGQHMRRPSLGTTRVETELEPMIEGGGGSSSPRGHGQIPMSSWLATLAEMDVKLKNGQAQDGTGIGLHIEPETTWAEIELRDVLDGGWRQA